MSAVSYKSQRALCRAIIELDNLHEIEKLRIIVYEPPDKNGFEAIKNIVEFKPNDFLIKSPPGLSKAILRHLPARYFQGEHKFELEVFSPQQEIEARTFGH